MIRQSALIIAIFFTGLFFLSSLINKTFAANVYNGQKKEAELIKQVEQQEREAAERVVIARPVVEYKAEADGLKDPFLKPGSVQGSDESTAQEKPLPALTVQGVIWGGKFSQAIINNKVVKEGDTLEGVKVVRITKDCVIISFENREYNLSSPAVLARPAGKPTEE